MGRMNLITDGAVDEKPIEATLHNTIQRKHIHLFSFFLLDMIPIDFFFFLFFC